MTKLYGNAIVGQSGGPTAVINASLLGVYRAARAWAQVDVVYGSLNGIEGILNDNLVNLNNLLGTDEQQTLLRQTPSAALRSCRYKIHLRKLLQQLRRHYAPHNR